MNPRIDLQIASLFRGKAELDPAIRTNQGGFAKARAIFDAKLQEPVFDWPITNLTVLGVHGVRTCTRLGVQNKLIPHAVV